MSLRHRQTNQPPDEMYIFSDPNGVDCGRMPVIYVLPRRRLDRDLGRSSRSFRIDFLLPFAAAGGPFGPS